MCRCTLDGFTTGPNVREGEPLGVGGEPAARVDELELHVVPVLLGGGSRLLDNLGDASVRLEQVRAVEGPGVTHLKYRTLPSAPS